MNGKKQLVPLALIFSLCVASSSSAQLTKLSAAYSAESSWSLATWVAYEGGLFKKYGLDVDLVLIRSAATITAALLAGEAPMIQLGGNGTIQAALQGADSVNVLTLVPIIPQSLVVTPNIKTAEDLKGKRIGVSRFGALSDLVVRRYLRKFGLDPVKDVTIVQIGGIPELFAAMKAGAISGGSMSPPVLTAAKKAGVSKNSRILKASTTNIPRWPSPQPGILSSASAPRRSTFCAARSRVFMRSKRRRASRLMFSKNTCVSAIPKSSKRDISMRCDLSSPGRSQNWRKPKRCWTSSSSPRRNRRTLLI